MSVLDTVKKGYLHIKTATDEYMRILPRTLASLILMNDGSTAEDSINGKLNKTSVVNNLTTTKEGFILDARQGSILKNEINNSKFQYAELKITSSPIDVERGKIPFTETGSIFYGNCFSFDDGCFVIGDNVNVVRVTASIYGSYSDNVFLYVTVNESEFFRHYVKVNQREYNGGCFSSIIQVTRGDKISIHTSNQLSLGVAGLESCFTIEKLD